MTRGRVPKFTKRFAEVGETIIDAARDYVREVQDGSFPAAEHTYRPRQKKLVDAAE